MLKISFKFIRHSHATQSLSDPIVLSREVFLTRQQRPSRRFDAMRFYFFVVDFVLRKCEISKGSWPMKRYTSMCTYIHIPELPVAGGVAN